MSNPYSLEGKTALVTGAARGIGRAIAEGFVSAGAKHVICADVLDDALAELPTSESLSAMRMDVTDEAAWDAAIRSAEAQHGQLDIVVNNAGILVFGTIDETSPDDFRRLFEVNVTGTFLGLRAALKVMKPRGSGAVINTSSASGMLPSNFVGAYAASKYAVRGLTRAAALEAGPFGVRVNSVHPGGVNTPMTNPMSQTQDELDQGFKFVAAQRGCRPEEIAHGVTYLASEAGAYCNGTELVIDGGMTAGVYFPGLPGSPIGSL